MDITRFIDSRDNAEYFATAFHEEDYPDVALRYAYLVWQSEKRSVHEKHGAWQELIDAMPDCELPARRDKHTHQKSLREYLRKYMELENTIIAQLYTETPEAVYQYKVRKFDASFGGYCPETDRTLYLDFLSCGRAFRKECAGDTDIVAVSVKKLWIGDGHKEIEAQFSPDMSELLSVEQTGILNDEDERLLEMLDLWFAFPTPFRRGDIVCLASPYGCNDRADNDPFVLTEVSADAEWGANHAKYGDSSD